MSGQGKPSNSPREKLLVNCLVTNTDARSHWVAVTARMMPVNGIRNIGSKAVEVPAGHRGHPVWIDARVPSSGELLPSTSLFDLGRVAIEATSESVRVSPTWRQYTSISISLPVDGSLVEEEWNFVDPEDEPRVRCAEALEHGLTAGFSGTAGGWCTIAGDTIAGVLLYGDGAEIGKWLAGDEETSDVDVVFATIGIFPVFGDALKFGWKFTKHKGDKAWSFLKTKVGRAGPVSAIKDIPGWKKVYDKYPQLQSKLDKLRDPGRSRTPKQHTGDFWENSSLVHLEVEDLRPSDINRRFHK